MDDEAAILTPAALQELLSSAPVLAEAVVAAALPAGTGLVRTQQVVLPANFPAGPWRFAVRADTDDALVETAEEDNVALGAAVTVPLALTWQLPAEAVAEDAPPFTALLLRNGGLAAELNVTLTSSAGARLLVPPTVRFAPGEASAPVPLTPRADGLVTSPVLAQLTAVAAGHLAGPVEAGFSLIAADDSLVEASPGLRVNASAPGHTPAETEVFILDDDLPVLALAVSPGVFSEGAGTQAAFVTVRRSPASPRPLVVALANSAPTAVS